MTIVKTTVHSAISIVNAIATGKGATLGISKNVSVEIETSHGEGITVEIGKKQMKSRLINRVVEKIVPKNTLSKTKLRILVDSEVPTGYGLKSSSAISSAVAMGCAKLFKPAISDFEILRAGVDASIETKVSLTGAYDDACACYFGGFIVTDNYKRKIIHSKKCQNNISAIIFIPKSEIEEYSGQIAIWLDSDEMASDIEAELHNFPLIALNFPVFSDGRSYTNARELRGHLNYQGEIRAIGDVLRDQLFYMSRCGFNTFAIRHDQDPNACIQALSDFSTGYQACTVEAEPLFRRF